MLVRILKLGVSVLLYVKDCLCSWSLDCLRARKYPGTCVVLYYHDIEDRDVYAFKTQIDLLTKIARPVALLREAAPVPGKHSVVVTFDDGLASFKTKALPVLIRHRIPATVFVPTGFMGQESAWTHKRGHQAQVMSADEIKALRQSELVTVGSHCVSHSHLTRLNDEDAWSEIEQSKKQLDRILGENVDTLSFPHGAYNQRHIHMAKAAGYRRVFSISPTLARPTGEDYVIGRVKVDPTDWLIEFRLKVLGAYRWLPAASQLKRALRVGLKRKRTGTFLN